MRVLIGKCFGIGNSVLSIPMIRAIQSLPDTVVDILVGSFLDDFGAYQVLSKVVGGQGKVFIDRAIEGVYDIAVMATPFDGRWRNGFDFRAHTVIDQRPRPDPSSTGFTSWKKHEVEYQMENAFTLGYHGPIPSCRFLPVIDRGEKNRLYLGVGYKKDPRGEAAVRYWGLENYFALARLLFDYDLTLEIVATGDPTDVRSTLEPMRVAFGHRFSYKSPPSIDASFDFVNTCHSFIGNDTGMMHVAASCDLNVVSMHFQPGAITKNPPWCPRKIALESLDKSLKPLDVFDAYRRLRDEH